MWCRTGDTSAFHPLLLNVLELPDFDDRLLNEAFGFFMRCATQAAAHLTDYFVSRGTAIQIAGIPRVEALLSTCVAAGLMSEIDVNGVTGYKLFDADPDFLHLRLKKEIDWERQRKEDSQRPSLTVPVRLRDGDGCRWCGRIVNWQDRKSARAGTYDHLQPSEAATVDTYVVSCKSCNSARKDGILPPGVTELLPPPARPLFSALTVKWLTENRWRIDNHLPVPDISSPADLTITRSRPTPQPAEHPDRTAASSATGQTGTAAAAAGATPETEPAVTRQPAGDIQGTAAHGATPTEGTAAVSATPTEGTAAEGATPTPRTAAEGATSPTPRTAAPSATAPTRTAAQSATSPDQAATGAGPHPAGSSDTSTVPDDPTPPAQRSDRYQTDPADQQGPGSDSTGRVGTGRVGSGLEPNPGTTHRTPKHRRRRGGRGGRSRTQQSKGPDA